MATNGTMAGVYSGKTFAAAFSNPSQLDILQIRSEGGTIVWNLSATGVASNNPVSPTKKALISRYQAQSVAAAWYNPSQLDILQVVSPVGDSVILHVDYLGVAHAG